MGGYLSQVGDKTTATLDNVKGRASATWKNDQGKKHDSHSAEHDAEQMAANEETQYQKNKKFSEQMAANDVSYLGAMRGNVDRYQGDIDQLSNEAQAAQKDSQNTYSNDIQPRMKDIMEQAHTNASSAMSLKDAMDPNNSVASGVRKLYSDQAQNEGRAGLASSATLQALGAQNFGTQLAGAGPMTGGQMAALMGQNQAASGAAYSNTQRRMQDLQDQGLAQGFNRSDIAYGQGRQAVGDYSNSVNNYQNSDARNQQQQAGYRNERGGYSGKTYGLQQQMTDATRGVGNAGVQRNMAIYNTHMGGNQANIAGDISKINADQAQQAQMITGGLQAGGAIVGGIYGGQAGATGGTMAGQAAGQAAAPTPYSTPAYGNYGSASASNPHPTMQQQQMGIMSYENANNPPPASGTQATAGLELTDHGSPYGAKSRRSVARAMRF